MPEDPSRHLDHSLVTAYALNMLDEFYKISQSITRYFSESLYIVATLQHDILPVRVVDQILEQQHDAKERALTAFNRVVTGNELCGTVLHNVGLCFRKFQNNEFWPFRIPYVYF